MRKQQMLYAQIRAGEAELAALRIILARLHDRVEDDAPDSHIAAEIVASYSQRCRALAAELDRLRERLTTSPGEHLGEIPRYIVATGGVTTG